MDAFDSDVLIYSIAAGHRLGTPIAVLFDIAERAGDFAGLGSVLLLPEVLSKPLRDGDQVEVSALRRLLSRLELAPVSPDLAESAATLGARYRLRAADAIHLATAVHLGADRFITNNRDDFPKSIREVDVTYPDEL